MSLVEAPLANIPVRGAVLSVKFVIVGTVTLEVSTVKPTAVEGAEVLPAVSVAVAVIE
jgi:hypothetical protein